MSENPAQHRESLALRLETLIRIRWLAVIGQTIAVLFVLVLVLRPSMAAERWVVLLGVCFACELIDSGLGMGYGTILTPTLLLLGYAPSDIVPTILAVLGLEGEVDAQARLALLVGEHTRRYPALQHRGAFDRSTVEGDGDVDESLARELEPGVLLLVVPGVDDGGRRRAAEDGGRAPQQSSEPDEGSLLRGEGRTLRVRHGDQPSLSGLHLDEGHHARLGVLEHQPPQHQRDPRLLRRAGRRERPRFHPQLHRATPSEQRGSVGPAGGLP